MCMAVVFAGLFNSKSFHSQGVICVQSISAGEAASSQECMVRGASLRKEHSAVSAEIDGQRLNASYSLHDQGNQQVTRPPLPAPVGKPIAASMGADLSTGMSMLSIIELKSRSTTAMLVRATRGD